MSGAQFLLAIRARRSLRALSISFRYAASTTGAAMSVDYCDVNEGVGIEQKEKRRRRDRGEGGQNWEMDRSSYLEVSERAKGYGTIGCVSDDFSNHTASYSHA
jgi:hypothetical protein